MASSEVNPMLLEVTKKQTVDRCAQTDIKSSNMSTSPSLCEKIKTQEDVLVGRLKTAMISFDSLLTVSSTSPISRSKSLRSMSTIGLSLPTPTQTVCEIARIYTKKVEADAAADIEGRRRQPLADFVQVFCIFVFSLNAD